jgi:hypothetical protein
MSYYVKMLGVVFLAFVLFVVGMTAANARTTVAAAGDIATGGNGDTKTSNLVLAMNVDAGITLGDNVYPSGGPTPTRYNQLFDPAWGRIAPLYMGVGNHDYYDGGPGGYLAYSGRPLQYTQALGDGWLLVHVDSQGPQSTAVNFLESALENSDAVCEIVAYHHPHKSSGDHSNIKKSVPLYNAAVAHDVEVVLNGHDHNYERFAPTSGTRQFVVGMGGVGTRGFKSVKAGSQKRITGNSNRGALFLTLDLGDYSFQYRKASGGTGTVLDSGTGTCT